MLLHLASLVPHDAHFLLKSGSLKLGYAFSLRARAGKITFVQGQSLNYSAEKAFF
jgi:hypothetical protein